MDKLKVIQSIFFATIVLVTMSRGENCSTYNPCGQFGYCIDNSNGDWECECKFWWNGTLCNQQTSAGIQVITLGILVALVLIVFYGLGIFFSIRQKKQQPEEEKKNENVNNPKLTNIAIANVKESARCSSILSIILLVVVATVSLIVKWSLLQPIHNELVKKYQQQEFLYYQANSICNVIDLENFNLLTFPVACFCILIFSIQSKRTSFMHEKLKGSIGLVIPVDFYAHVKRTFAAVVFAVFADELLDIIYQVLTGDPTQAQGVIFGYLYRITQVLFIGARYYPVLAAVYMDSLLTLICGTLYAWLDLSITIVYQSLCQSDYYSSESNFDPTVNGTDLAQLLQYYGTGPNLIIIQLCSDIPRYLCLAYINIQLPMLLVRKIQMRIEKQNQIQHNRLRLTREEKILLHSSAPYSVEMSYVRNLFRPIHQRSHSRLFIARILPKLIYEWRDDFRYSSRVLCIYAAVFLLLFFITIQSCIPIIPLLDQLRADLQTIINTLSTSGNTQDVNVSSDFPLPNFVRPYIVAIFTALIVTVIQLLVLLVNIRRNLFQVFRGDDSEIPKREKSNYVNYATGNFHFAGYFIGYLLWGYMLVLIFAFLIYICIDAFITYGSVKFLEKFLKIIIPPVLFILFKQYLNKILARYIFLQDYGEILAINNRRMLLIFLYFNFFLDSFLGFISSIIRIIKSVIGGCLYMCRLDYSPLGRKLENFDAGFSAYCGFIHMEAAHRNPLMLAVVSYLYSQMKAKQYATTINRYSSKAIRKWHLAVFLLHNPTMVFLRKNALIQLQHDKIKAISEQNRRISIIEQMSHRPSLITEKDLRNLWERKC